MLAVADHDRGHLAAEPHLGLRQRVDEEVGTLQVAHHAYIKEIGGIWCRRNLLEFGLAQAVVDEPARTVRLADLAVEGATLIFRDEQDVVGEARHQPFEREEQLSRRRPFVVVQATAMRCVEAGYAKPENPQQ